MTKQVEVSIVGGSGYTGGEVLRLLLNHPFVKVKQITSQRYVKKPVSRVHPNLRGFTKLSFSSIDDLEPCDALVLGLPHKEVASRIEDFALLAEYIVDKSADFRLGSVSAYEDWYNWQHPAKEWLTKFTYGIPELYRKKIAKSKYVAAAGCNATVSLLALYPFVKCGVVDLEHLIVDVKTGSSEGGNKFSLGTHHPERGGVVRSYALTSHRHIGEIEEQLSIGQSKFTNDHRVHFSATAVELIRGALATAHLFLKEDLSEKELGKILRDFYQDEPFIRFVRDRRGVYRMPEPKILVGTNFCDIGFQKDRRSNRFMVVSAIDNLMKGAAGQAVQCLNIMLGFPEKSGLSFIGLHPV